MNCPKCSKEMVPIKQTHIYGIKDGHGVTWEQTYYYCEDCEITKDRTEQITNVN